MSTIMNTCTSIVEACWRDAVNPRVAPGSDSVGGRCRSRQLRLQDSRRRTAPGDAVLRGFDRGRLSSNLWGYACTCLALRLYGIEPAQHPTTATGQRTCTCTRVVACSPTSGNRTPTALSSSQPRA
jgi:hypothetical protein